MGYRKAARMRRTQYVRGHYRRSRNGNSYYVGGHVRNDYGGDGTGCAVAAGVVLLVPTVLLVGALAPGFLLAFICPALVWFAIECSRRGGHENAFGLNASKVNQSLQQASAINARQQDRPTKEQQAEAITTTARSVVWLNSEQTRFRYSDDAVWLTRNCRPGQPDSPPWSISKNPSSTPQVQKGPRGGRYYLVRGKNGQRYRKYF